MTQATNRILIITPAKDEGEYIEKTLTSLVNQTHRPAKWIIVDDGSDDDTGQIAEQYAADHDWIKVVYREKGQARKVGPGVIDAFYHGLSHAELNDFDFVCKMDADIELKPGYFENMMKQFGQNPRLGTASGKCFVPVKDGYAYERTGDEFSHGVCKLFRRECFQEIGGFVREVMWDGIDCHRCRMLGWEAVSLHDPELHIIHLRLMGSSFKSVYHGRMRWGRGQYFMGTHPLYSAGIAFYRMFERPWILGGLCIFWGYFVAWLRDYPRYEDREFRSFLRHWQKQELKRRITGQLIGPPPKTPQSVEVNPHELIQELQSRIQPAEESRSYETADSTT
jgi:poly-beta-1,6-N-acetyl-D-glucosamine synthase